MPALIDKKQKLCVVEACGRKVIARGLCAGHYARFREGREMDSPLGDRSGEQVQIATLRLLRDDAEYLFQHAESAGSSPYELSRAIVEEWIRARKRKGLEPGA